MRLVVKKIFGEVFRDVGFVRLSGLLKGLSHILKGFLGSKLQVLMLDVYIALYRMSLQDATRAGIFVVGLSSRLFAVAV